MYSIEQFRNLNKAESLIMTQHSRKRFAERGISVDDILYLIKTGTIIEQYPDAFPSPSCLVFGYSGERALHAVLSIEDERIYVVTAYAPDPEKWESDMRTRKERDE
ncbi:MAG: DUF4258 domain-containing protein [Clostridia bacterium]|nr:DUF4258 domain-containing protein [Clostridia bacterium]